jgi:4-amino-4-deoxy-L-arabinose transferase-like glycosyltransferase
MERSILRTAGLLGCLASGLFALGLGDGPFVDEYAYITQSYQADLFFNGRTHDPAWLETLSYDLVPLPKYLINASFRLAGIARPARSSAVAWYGNSHFTWGSRRELVMARLPSVIMAGMGCAAMFLLGALVRNELTGWIAALLLTINPLYRLHAHRAMSEASCEAFLLLALALGLWAWKITLSRSRIVGPITFALTGGLAGLSILAKFNGILTLLCLAGWCLLGMALPGVSHKARLMLSGGTIIAGIAAWFVFLAGNPFMTAHPSEPLPPELQSISEMPTWRRFLFLVDHRRSVSQGQQQKFSHNAVHTPMERAKVLAVQGFGRFGPFGPSKSDSTVRYDLVQDLSAILWLPLVLAGGVATFRLGRRQLRGGEPPTAWALLVWAGLALAVVVAYLPMAWDRYLLPIQSPMTLLAAVVSAMLVETLVFRFSIRGSGP